MELKFRKGDKVKVRYSFEKFYTGTVLWSQEYRGDEWVTVRPDDESMIFTFGSARDMNNGYKTYMANHPVLGDVFAV